MDLDEPQALLFLPGEGSVFGEDSLTLFVASKGVLHTQVPVLKVRQQMTTSPSEGKAE